MKYILKLFNKLYYGCHDDVLEKSRNKVKL